MYKKFFGLRASPFTVNPDPRYLFLTRHTQEALATLTYGIQSRKGFVLLTGEIGTGKTTLLNKLLEWLRVQRVATVRLHNGGLWDRVRNSPEESCHIATESISFGPLSRGHSSSIDYRRGT